jgi:hypothetical protein
MRTLIIITLLLFSSCNHSFARTNNINQVEPIKFKTAQHYFTHGELYGYSELKNADINIREKLQFNELKNIIKEKVNEKTIIKLTNIYNQQYESILPEEEIFLFCTIKDSKRYFEYKYIIIKAKSYEIKAKGSGKQYK